MTLKDRLRLARRQAGFPSARAAALAHGWTVSTYTGHEGTGNDISVEAAAKYAAAYERSLAWLIAGTPDPAKTTCVLPVCGVIGAWGVVQNTNKLCAPRRIREIVVPFVVEGAAGAFLVPGPTRNTHYKPDTALIVAEHTRDIDSLIGSEVVCCCGDGGIRFGELFAGDEPGIYNLEGKPGKVTHAGRVQWAARVRYALYPGDYQLQERDRTVSDVFFPDCKREAATPEPVAEAANEDAPPAPKRTRKKAAPVPVRKRRKLAA